VEETAAELRRCEEELSEAARARRRLPALEEERRALQAEQDRCTEGRLAAAAEGARLQESVQAHERALRAVRDEIEAELDEHEDSVAGAVRAVEQQLGRVGAARTSLRLRQEAATRLADLDGQAAAAAQEQGFGSWQEVEAHVLPPHRRSLLAERADDRAAVTARARAVLEEADLGAGDEDDGPDPRQLEAWALEAARAEETAVAADRTLALEEARVEALQQLLDRCERAVTSWAPVRDQALRAESMSRLVRGMGQDNQLQMRLSAYVLATRLDQVVAAANERLGHLRDQRYLLQRSGRVERRGSQSGLGLEVVDQWTGDVRSPSTLSGGETFVVSLSLALGLADVVTQEAGGTEVETLFVDEGFGTLDADTLDDVMDRLDGLRAGGRTVGVVSHVTELRSRITTQVEVRKGRSGSTVSVGTLVG
jgi:exonuclease SbcC